MKKIMGTICALVMTASFSTAQASILTDWTYGLSSATSNLNGELGIIYDSNFVDGQGLSFQTGGIFNSVEAQFDQTGAFGVTGSITQTSGEYVFRHDTGLTPSSNIINNEKITDLSFQYDVTSAGGEVAFSLTYTLPLYSYYDATHNTSYIYYDTSKVVTTGQISAMYDDYLYVALGFNLMVDGKTLTEYTAANGSTYSGWAVNAETMSSYYDNYVVGGENIAIGDKRWDGFEVKSSFNMLSYQIGGALPSGLDFDLINALPDSPTPTPEPATMLLTGLGLAGLGALKRRRNKVA